MASVNKFIGIGNTTKDVELRYTQGGDAVGNWTIACNESWKDKSGEKQESVEFVRCVAFGRTAEVAGEYVKKGDPCYVEGKLKTRKWTDKEGVERYTTEVVVDRLQLLGGRRDSGDGDGSSRPQQRREAPKGGKQRSDDFDDDTPF